MRQLKYFIVTVLFTSGVVKAQEEDPGLEGKEVREYFIQTLTKIADPVLQKLSENQLKVEMPVGGLLNEIHIALPLATDGLFIRKQLVASYSSVLQIKATLVHSYNFLATENRKLILSFFFIYICF